MKFQAITSGTSILSSCNDHPYSGDSRYPHAQRAGANAVTNPTVLVAEMPVPCGGSADRCRPGSGPSGTDAFLGTGPLALVCSPSPLCIHPAAASVSYTLSVRAGSSRNMARAISRGSTPPRSLASRNSAAFRARKWGGISRASTHACLS